MAKDKSNEYIYKVVVQQAQQLFAIAGFVVKLKFMFQNVVRWRGTILQQVGFDIPLRSIYKPSYARNCK
jgi:hypothetical protein